MATRGPKPAVTDQEIEAVIRRAERPFVTIPEVAEKIDLSGSRTRERLNSLVEETALERAKVGGRAVVYWFSDE